jgi:hypothetical protein
MSKTIFDTKTIDKGAKVIAYAIKSKKPMTKKQVEDRVAKIKNELIAVRNGYVQELMDKFNGKVDKQSHVWVYGICWASFQYGIFNYLTKINKPLGYFGKHDVATLLDFYELRDDQKTTPPIVHYWSVGYKDFLPEEYLIGLEDKMYKSISNE